MRGYFMKKSILCITFLVWTVSSQAMWRKISSPRVLFAGMRQTSLANTFPSIINDRTFKTSAIVLARKPLATKKLVKNDETTETKTKPSWIDASPVKPRTNFFADVRDWIFGTTPERELQKQKEALAPLAHVFEKPWQFTPEHIEEVINNLPESAMQGKEVDSFFKGFKLPFIKIHSLLQVIFKAGDFHLDTDFESTEKNIEIIFDQDKETYCIEHKKHNAAFFDRQHIHENLVQKMIDKGAPITQETFQELLFTQSENEKGSLRLGAIKALLDSDKNAELLADANNIQAFADLIQEKMVITKKGRMFHCGSGTDDGNLHVIELITIENYDMIRLLHLLDDYFAKNSQSSIVWDAKKEEIMSQHSSTFATFEKNEKAGKKIAKTTMYSKKSNWPYTKEEDAEAFDRTVGAHFAYWR